MEKVIVKNIKEVSVCNENDEEKVWQIENNISMAWIQIALRMTCMIPHRVDQAG